jgi:endonuclease/exonuclease/phosphatase family metal-dependent hydrolase
MLNKYTGKQFTRRQLIAAILIIATISSLTLKNMAYKLNNPIIEKTNYDKSTSFSILSANVGNLSVGCRKVLNKLCYKDVEERIAANIKYLSPDIIALQEVLAPWQCKEINETNKNKVCNETQLTPQVRRLVGEDYTIACNSRNQFECIAVKRDFGEIIDCPNGETCNKARTAPEIDGCDNGFTISSVTVKAKTAPTLFDVINFHPQSTSSTCRAKMINAALYGNETAVSIIQEKKVLLLGDFNLDPWRDDDESVIAWNTFIQNGWNDSKLEYHSGIAENSPPFFTSFLFYKPRALDFIVSNFANGICSTLGESPNTLRLDGGKGTDHRALFGILSLR